MTDGEERHVINSNKLIVASSLLGTHFFPASSHYARQTSASPMTTVGQGNLRTSSVHPRLPGNVKAVLEPCWGVGR